MTLFDEILRQKFPGHVSEYRFHSERRWKFDHCWPHAKVALEIEGGVWTGGRHVRGAGFIRDMEKYNEAALLGWHVYRVTPQQIKNGQALELIARIFQKRIEEGSKKWKLTRKTAC